MGDLSYQNYTNKCQGWVNPDSLSFNPQINSLTGYQSPAGSNTVVSINGINFCSYSRIAFGTLSPTVYFINSNVLQFYVPNTLSSGTFPVQVFNGSIGSNVVNYTIDNASGYWIMNPNGSISNTNQGSTNMVQVQSLSRGLPKTLESIESDNYPFANPYVVQKNDNWFNCNSTFAVIFVTLPRPENNPGREIMFKMYNNGVLHNDLRSTSVNILPLNSFIPSDIIISSGIDVIHCKSWVTLVSNGTYWMVMQGV